MLEHLNKQQLSSELGKVACLLNSLLLASGSFTLSPEPDGNPTKTQLLRRFVRVHFN